MASAPQHLLLRHVASTVVAPLLLLFGACSDQGQGDASDGRESAARLSDSFGSGSGVYLGEGVLLTNWHVCEAGRPLEDRPIAYNAADGDGPPYQQFAREQAPDVAGRAANGRAAPFPIIANGFVSFPVSPTTRRSIDGDFSGKVVFTQQALELCIIELVPKTTALPAERPLRTIDTHEVHIGQEVVLTGYPLGVNHAITERCRVTATPTVVRDPDLVNPSETSVRSFAIDCKTAQHGSSGSPVFDASTGALLGLAWTSSCRDGLGSCKPPTFVSAASDWLRQGERPPSEYAQLADLLDRFGSPP